MDRVFNQGIGMVIVAAAGSETAIIESLTRSGEQATVIGEIVAEDGVKIE
jgi:phosphoribosylaminoimidazole (AIR) synthetase